MSHSSSSSSSINLLHYHYLPPDFNHSLRFCLTAPSSSRWSNPDDYFSSSLAMPTTTLPAGSNSPSFNVPHSVRTKKLNNSQQKKEEIEKEVWMLREMLDQEEKTREILEQVQKHQLPSSSSSITLPASLPPKMKELITELSIVEGEISRLEVQISHLQINLKQEQDETLKQATTSSSRRAWQTSESYNDDDNITSYQAPMLPKLYPKLPPPSPMVHKAMMKNENNNSTKATTSHHQENATFGTKTLHFINKAIKGDYATESFHKSNEKVGIVEKENHRSVQHESKLQESRNMKKIRMMKSPSPLREPRYSSPNKPNKDRVALDTSLDMPPKSLSSTILMEDGQNIQKWHPNKLAENIMKCLNFIYVRLLRTTRVMELEKTGPISRSTNFSLSSRSFRIDNATSSLSKSMNLVSCKESRQQDPYGIFDIETSLARDIGPYKNLVIFTSSSMDSKCISSSSSVSLIQKLRVLMNNLETVDLRVLSQQQKLAFWINMFNACVMHGYLQHGVPKTAEKLQSLVYNKATMNVGGKNISAHTIEHCILRKTTTSTMTQDRHEEMIIRKLYGVEATDPNITFALSCGTRSSPAVRIYTGEGVTTELEKSKLEYLQASVVVTAAKRIGLPELLVKHATDFVVPRVDGGGSSGEMGQLGSLVKWVCNQLPTSGSLRKSMVECFKNNNTKASTSSPVVEKIPYDFEFQYLLAI
ncbi:PREDICTED: uncharacterized protein LOC104762179 isoform X2 [Camelina sativa]|uniref:Uncharacterized protein LOC104762179 isoform X1 n=1 Tax=Camelina sativa TaxID=90675 RepID=A0ABM0XC23_CAMSA|nr:PREDICTED: uncharacterized protein LOC104762179 isoform X1 [Camelina sativa]XP_010483725.1 PREDICTED: uncharacterized protein LOC104762179 isoform X2 [Camelina sativa]